MSTVLVTGGSGYVGTQLIAALLRDGRRVRATAEPAGRTLSRVGQRPPPMGLGEDGHRSGRRARRLQAGFASGVRPTPTTCMSHCRLRTK